MMYLKNMYPLFCRRRLLQVASFGFNTLQVNRATISKCLDTDETLAIKLGSILQTCPHKSALWKVKQVHAHLIVNGPYNTECLLGSKVLGVYFLCGSFTDAKNLFYRLNLFYASPWNWMIRGYATAGLFDIALAFFFKMLAYGTYPDKYTFPYVIKATGCMNSLKSGKWVHEMVSSMGFESDVYVGSCLMKFYLEMDCVDAARHLFDKMPERDIVLWNVMLNGYLRSGSSNKVAKLFTEMRNTEMEPDSVTYSCVLSVCVSESMPIFGTQIHSQLVKSGLELDPQVNNTLLAMYSKCGCLFDAHKLWDKMPKTNVVAWNAMIGGYVQHGLMDEAMDIFRKMISTGIKPDKITFASFLPSISEKTNLSFAKQIHGHILRHGVTMDVFLISSLIDVYLKCRDAKMARHVFNSSSSIDVVICTAMISGYILNGMNVDALDVFRLLIKEKMRPNAVTLASILPACAALSAIKLGKELHSYTVKSGLDKRCYVGSSITDMYSKCGQLELAHNFFIRMSEKDAICWNTMITSCSQNGKPEDAINLFRQMGFEGAEYDSVSISAALSACANLPSLQHGKEIHCSMIKGISRSDLFAESALIDMYAKCGHLRNARSIFDLMRFKNEISWNSIIAAYGNHGCLNDSLILLHEMMEEGFKPDHVTFLSLLSACGHAGKVDKGKHIFQIMTKEHGIEARMEHYACLVDLLGRSGRLNEACESIKEMLIEPDAGIWGTLLGACRLHGNLELAEMASDYLFKLDPKNSGYYVLLSNLQADAGRWDNVNQIRGLMEERGVQKVPGYSWIELKGKTHMFSAADTSHPYSHGIYLLLKNLLLELKEEGYVPQPYFPIQPGMNGIHSPLDSYYF
ncbi:pentatricopeptide repeat-containing protein At4g21300 [Impatiens glandulifera]|uniref:pentatricopeptide repeat-containing protein At4g21300 n=1 Tax=Impatiens glandulifera TaxID=253017 RepID=UPI001FB10CCA|nr:pentatricopeptide repeat-containing protein At4g21300 [Impatiens glandulifera]